MACLLQPECNFLHGFFRWKLLVEIVDVDNAGNQMHTMEHKTSAPPHNHQKDDDLSGGGR